MDPINLDEFDAALAEERLEPYPIVFLGERFVIPNERLWDAEVSDAIEGNHLWRVFALLLGPEELADARGGQAVQGRPPDPVPP